MAVWISSGGTQWNAAYCNDYVLAGRVKAEDTYPFRKQDNLGKFSKQQEQKLKIAWNYYATAYLF